MKIFVLSILMPLWVVANPVAHFFELSGELVQPGTATAIVDSNLRIKVSILGSNGNCVLYEEEQLVATNNLGLYRLQVGSVTGDAKRTSRDRGNTMPQVFQNTVAINGRDENNTNCSYTPSARDGRRVRLTLTPSSSGQAQVLAPDLELGALGQAMVAETVGGYGINQLAILGAGDLTQANLQAVFATGNAAKLNTLLTGDPTNFLRSDATSVQLPPLANEPSVKQAGQIWYDSGTIKFWNGVSEQTLGISGGGIVSLVAGTGLNSGAGPGGTITTSGTLNVDVGTTANKIVQLDGSGALPAVSGANLANLNASELNSGTLPVARLPALAGDVTSSVGSNSVTINTVPLTKGGTGLTSGGTANQILGMNSDGTISEYKTIAAGSNVTVTHGANSITIAALGGTGTVSNVTGIAPIQVVNSTSTPEISILTANTTTTGALTSTDWNTFNNKQSSTLSSGQVWVGNGSNIATARSLSISDIRSINTGNWFTPSGACAAGEVLQYQSPADQISCASLVVTSSQVTTALGFTPANATNVVAKTGDTMTGALNLPSNGLSVGTSQLVVNGGSVGIGTTAPASLLHLESSLTNTVTGGLGHLRINNSSAVDGDVAAILFQTLESSASPNRRAQISSGRDGANTAGYLSFATRNSAGNFGESLRLTSSGNVGIGTAVPAEKLEVVGNIKATQLCIGADCRSAWPTGGGGGVSSVASANGDIGVADGSTTPTLTLNSGTGANQILKLNSSAQIPAVSGVNLTSLNASELSSGIIPAGRMPALTGDVTMSSGTTATTIANNAVTSAKIADGAVTMAKLNASSASTGDVIQWNGTAWAPASITAGTVTSVSGTGAISVINGTTSPEISIATANGTTTGALTGADWTTFNNKLGTSLASGLVWVGNGSGVANARSLNVADIKSNVTGPWFNVSGACDPGEALSFSSASDSVSCQPFALTSSQVTTALGFTPASGGSFVAKSGDTMTGALNLPSNGLVAGTNQLVVASGRVGMGTSVPGSSLHVYRASGANDLQVQTGSVIAGMGTIGSQVNVGAQSDHPLGLMVNGLERIVVDTQGRVAIGYNPPETRFHVQAGTTPLYFDRAAGSSLTGSTLMLRSSRGSLGSETASQSGDLLGRITFVGHQGASGFSALAESHTGLRAVATENWDNINQGSELVFATTPNGSSGGLDRMTISKDGNVGIGTGVPAAKLEIMGTGQTVANITDVGARGDALSLIGVGTSAGTGGAILFGNSQSKTAGSVGFSAIKGFLTSGAGNTSGDIVFATRTSTSDVALTEKMRIFANGKVSIGTSVADKQLEVHGDGDVVMSVRRSQNANSREDILRLQRRRADATSPGANFGGQLLFSAEGFVDGSDVDQVKLGAGWEVAQTDTTTSRDSYFNIQTMLNGSISERMRVSADGNVGIGTTSPGTNTRLNVQGQIRSSSSSTTSGAIDFASGNAVTTTFDCGSAITFANLRDGGAYTLVVTGTGTTMCSFSTSVTGDDSGTVTYRFAPLNGARLPSSHTVYSLQRVGTTVYVAWITGF